MHLSENEGIQRNSFLITGGLGFVGSALCSELVRRGAKEVRTLDLRTSSPWSFHLNNIGVKIIKGDVRNIKDVEKALRGVDCVFHLASYGMSGKEMLQIGNVDEVNINGTCHVLDTVSSMGLRGLLCEHIQCRVRGKPFFMKAHRWGSAFPAISIAGGVEKCLWDGTKRLAICGDFCVSPNIEGAILSGTAAAAKFTTFASSF